MNDPSGLPDLGDRPARLLKLKVWCTILLVATLVLDLWSKQYMQDLLGLSPDPDVTASTRAIDVIPHFLAWQGTWNPGVTFGILPGETTLILLLTGLATIALSIWLAGTRSRSKCLHIGLAIILAGAIGNLYDRLLWNKVRDFILIYIGDLEHPTWKWPNFNVADSGIVCGVILVLWDALFGQGAKEAHAKHERAKARKAAEQART
jgi:signal peptidase II